MYIKKFCSILMICLSIIILESCTKKEPEIGEKRDMISFKIELLEYNPYSFNSDFDLDYYTLNYDFRYNNTLKNRRFGSNIRNEYHGNPCLFFNDNNLYFCINYTLYNLSSPGFDVVAESVIDTVATGDDIYIAEANTEFTTYLYSLKNFEKKLYYTTYNAYNMVKMYYCDNALYTTFSLDDTGEWNGYDYHFGKGNYQYYNPRLYKVLNDGSFNLLDNGDQFYVLNNKLVNAIPLYDEKKMKIVEVETDHILYESYFECSKYLYPECIFKNHFYQKYSHDTEFEYDINKYCSNVDIYISDYINDDYNHYFYSEKELSNKIAPITFTKYIINDSIYLICEHEIYKYNLKTDEFELLIEDEKEIYDLYFLNDYGFFYLTVERDETLLNPIYTLYYSDYNNKYLIAKFKLDLGFTFNGSMRN